MEQEIGQVMGEGEEEDKVVVMEKEKEKISTSGPRLTRRESYRADKKFQIRLTRSKFPPS